MDGIWLEALGCPCCQAALQREEGDDLLCPACSARFAAGEQPLRLLCAQDETALARFADDYRRARIQEGWPPLTHEQALALPHVCPPGQPRLYWQVRSQSFARFARFLAQAGPPPEAGPVADLGAGIGWLSYHLARSGYRVLAVDASLDTDFGLGAARRYQDAVPKGRLVLAQGDLEHPPLRKAQWSMIVFNASLHYTRDLDATLARAAQALREGGCLVVLDTPISHHPVPGTGRGDRHLGRQELEAALLRAGLRARWLAVGRGPQWWIYRLKSWLNTGDPFSFPMLIAGRSR